MLIISQNAEDDIALAALWYELQKTGLGTDFLIALEAELSAITQNPFHYQELRFGYRRGIVKRFPYGIVYRADASKVIVVAVWHFSRKPWAWRKREK